MKDATSTTFFHDKNIIEVNNSLIERLKKEASKDALKRARFNLHRSHIDKVHEMIVVLNHVKYDANRQGLVLA